MSLSKRIILIITFGLIAVISTTAVVSFFFTSSLLKDSISNQQLQLVQQTMDKVDRLQYQQYSQVKTIAEEGTIKEYLHNPQKTTDIVKRIKELADITGLWESVSVVDMQGTIVAATDPKNAGIHITAYPQNAIAFLQVIQSDHVYVSDIVVSQQTQKPMMIFAAPVRSDEDESKPIIGVIIAHSSWGTTEAILANISGDNGPYVSMINHLGNLIGTYKGREEQHLFTPYITNKEVMQAVLAGKSGSTLIQDAKNNASLLSYVPQKGYKDYKGSGWGMILETPYSIAFASVSESAYRITGFTGIILLLLAVIIFFVLNKYYVHPLFSLTETARDIAHGDLHKRIYISSHDEIGELGEILNQMTEHLTSSHFALQEKSDELQKSMKELHENRLEISYIKKAMLHIVENLKSYKHQFEGIRQTADIVIDNVYEGVVITDQQGFIIHANQSAHRLLGDALADAVNKSLTTTIPFIDDTGKKVTPEEHVLYQAFHSTEKAHAVYSYQIEGGSVVLSVTVIPIVIETKAVGSVVIIKKP
jgi:HAMP domain-containing protein